jgi:hypothetical protein
MLPRGQRAVKSFWMVMVVMPALAVFAAARPQTKAGGSTPSLGALARRLRAQRKARDVRPVKVFTNDNVPHYGMITVLGTPESLHGIAPQQPPRVERVHHRREERSTAAKDAFKRENPCPSTGRGSGPCPGYVIDHVKPLACGGADEPFNMQWQTDAEGKAKDKWERKGCGK